MKRERGREEERRKDKMAVEGGEGGRKSLGGKENKNIRE